VPGADIIGPFLAALADHLRERGWLERTMVHICDEPSDNNSPSWCAVADACKRAAPGLRLIDAIEGPDFRGHLDVWVPKLSHLRSWWPHFAAARDEDGAELWFYTCCHPTGLYPNRFLDYSLTKTRILHWYNWRFGATGYLHWGLNFWTDDPFSQVTNQGLPPGDCFIIYPGPDGPLSSIRYEALRDGIEDYECLWLLADRTRERIEALGGSEMVEPGERSDDIARSVVRDFLDYAKTPAELEAARGRVAESLAALDADPPLIVATDPGEAVPLAPGPIVVRVRGVTDPGATVTVNGQKVVRREGAGFVIDVWPSVEAPDITIVATLDGRETTVVRHFRIMGA
jgi:hypothetical protein